MVALSGVQGEGLGASAAGAARTRGFMGTVPGTAFPAAACARKGAASKSTSWFICVKNDSILRRKPQP